MTLVTTHVSRVACVVVCYALGTVFLVLYRHEIASSARLFYAVVIPYAVATVVAFTADLAAARSEVTAWRGLIR